MHTIEWSSRQSPLEADPGINALELLLSFTLYIGLRLPVPWKINSKTSYTSFRDYDSAEIGMLPPEKRSAGQQANTLVTIVRQLDAMSGKWHLPVPQQKNIQHLKIFYPLRNIQVFPIRPKLPFADNVIRNRVGLTPAQRSLLCPLDLFITHRRSSLNVSEGLEDQDSQEAGTRALSSSHPFSMLNSYRPGTTMAIVMGSSLRVQGKKIKKSKK